ncbi:hypothetical protein, partial [Leptospira interrogans]|uniref:hypothetical protein n=1 Tax=Leptospira interrogans TaxID=173 RepID=UPI003D1651FD
LQRICRNSDRFILRSNTCGVGYDKERSAEFSRIDLFRVISNSSGLSYHSQNKTLKNINI